MHQENPFLMYPSLISLEKIFDYFFMLSNLAFYFITYTSTMPYYLVYIIIHYIIDSSMGLNTYRILNNKAHGWLILISIQL